MKFETMRWEEIYKRLPKDRPLIGAEIGVWTGKTSGYLLENLPMLTMYMIDAWDDPKNNPSFFQSGAKMARYDRDVYEDAYNRVMDIHNKYPDRSVVIRSYSLDAVKMFEDSFFDFSFIDGDHSYEGVKSDTIMWLPKVKAGGLFCGHDYNPDPNKGFRGVKKAVDEIFPLAELGDDHTWFWKVI
jgi:hypothetical protein